MYEIERIRDLINKQTVPPIFLWYGEERFLIREALSLLKSHYLKDDPSGSGIETISGRELTPGEIVERANTFSFFAQRLIIVEDIPYFQDSQNFDLESYFMYFANPNPSTCLLFVSNNIHKGRKFYKELAKAGEIFEFTTPKKPQEWLSWLHLEVKARGKTITNEDAVFFLEWAGHQTGILNQEIDKLTIYVGEREQITKNDIKEITTRTIEATVFELLDAVAKRSLENALSKLNEVLREEHLLKVLTMLVRQIRLSLGALAWRKRGGDISELGPALGIRSPYEAQKIWRQAMTMNEQSLFKALPECLNTELALKSSGGDPAFLMETLIIKLCQK